MKTNLVSESEQLALKKKFSKLDRLSISKITFFNSRVVAGADNLYRIVPKEGRTEYDLLEGTPLEKLLGEAFTDEIRTRVAGKVVLVEFWGSWCGPCLQFIPELDRLHAKFGDDFEVLTIHSKAGAESVGEYLKKHPKQWPNITDRDGKLAEQFSVSSFPCTFLVGRNGLPKVAIPYRFGLDRSVEHLLKLSN